MYALRGYTKLLPIYHAKLIIRITITVLILYWIALSTIDMYSVSHFKKSVPDISVNDSIQGEERQVTEKQPIHVDERGPCVQRLPSAIIIGVNKCGTGALRDMLSMHPQIVSAPGEIEFFNNEILYKKGVDEYRKKMPKSYEDQITIEKSPQYFRSQIAPHRIKMYNATIKLLLIVKEPVQRLLSGYAQNKAYGRPPFEPFEDAVIDRHGEVKEIQIVKDSIYWPPLRHYLEVFQRDQILVIDGDALNKNPLPEIEKVEKFLNIGENITSGNFYYNETKGFWCMNSDVISGCMGPGKGRVHEEVRPDVITKLRKFYATHNEHFYKLTGIDFNWPES